MILVLSEGYVYKTQVITTYIILHRWFSHTDPHQVLRRSVVFATDLHGMFYMVYDLSKAGKFPDTLRSPPVALVNNPRVPHPFI